MGRGMEGDGYRHDQAGAGPVGDLARALGAVLVLAGSGCLDGGNQIDLRAAPVLPATGAVTLVAVRMNNGDVRGLHTLGPSDWHDHPTFFRLRVVHSAV